MIPPQMVKDVAYGRASELRELATKSSKRLPRRRRLERIARYLTISAAARTRYRTVTAQNPIGAIDQRQPSCNV